MASHLVVRPEVEQWLVHRDFEEDRFEGTLHSKEQQEAIRDLCLWLLLEEGSLVEV